MEALEQKKDTHEELRQLLDDGGRMRRAGRMVNSLHPSEVARLLESLPRKKRTALWELVDSDIEGDVLVEVSDEVRDGLIDSNPTIGISLPKASRREMIALTVERVGELADVRIASAPARRLWRHVSVVDLDGRFVDVCQP